MHHKFPYLNTTSGYFSPLGPAEPVPADRGGRLRVGHSNFSLMIGKPS